MNTISKNTPLKEAALFFGLTLGLSYLVFWGPLALFQIPTISFVSGTTGPAWAIALFVIGGFVPSLTALLLTRCREGRSGLKQLGRRIIQIKIGWQWYLAALGYVILGTLGQLLLLRLLKQSFDYCLFVAQLGSMLPLIVLGPLSEEIGWRGYALGRLQTRWNGLVSSLIVGLAWGLWHGPLFLMVGTSQHELRIPFIGFVIGLMILSIAFTWLHNHTRGSILMAIFFHWIYTYSAQVIASGVTRSPLYNYLEYLPYLLATLIVLLIWGRSAVRQSSRHS